MSWLTDVIERDLNTIKQEKNLPGWFSAAAISNIPYVSFPELPEQACIEIHEQCMNVMRNSRALNSYKEVAATFRLDKESEVLYTYGTYDKILLFDDNRVSSLVKQANKENGSIVINIHNHPGNGIFSVNDLYVFTENPCIKVMMITNTKGELSFLFRPEHLRLQGIVTQVMDDVVSDTSKRIDNWKKLHPNTDYELSDILSIDEMKLVVRNVLDFITQNGVDYCEYSDQEKINKFIFRGSVDQKTQAMLNIALKNADRNYLKETLHEEYKEIEGNGYEFQGNNFENREDRFEFQEGDCTHSRGRRH